MKTVRFGRTNVQVSSLGLGTWAMGGPRVVNNRPVGWWGTRDETSVEALVHAAEVGITHWDSADVYGDGHAETLVGQALGQVDRDSLFLTSKVGWDPGDYDHYFHPEQIRKQLERSLTNLRTDRIDLYYLHHCDFGSDDEYLDDAMEAMLRFRDEGKIRFVGLSDYKLDNIRTFVKRVDPDVVQCYRNVVDDSYAESGLKSWVDENDLGVVFFSPLKHSLLLGLYEGPVTFGEGDHRNALQDFRDLGLLSRLRSCRMEMEKRFTDREQPVLHALIGSLLADSSAASVLVGLHRPEYVDFAVRAGEPLSAEDAAWVRKIYEENGQPTRASWKNFQQSGG